MRMAAAAATAITALRFIDCVLRGMFEAADYPTPAAKRANNTCECEPCAALMREALSAARRPAYNGRIN
jgi:hypothetical protein